MTEWVVLALLVPLILIPVVLMFAFAGCSLLFDEVLSAPAFQAVFDRDVDRRNRTVIIRIEPTRLLRGGTHVTLSIGRPVTGPLLITALSPGPRIVNDRPTAELRRRQSHLHSPRDPSDLIWQTR